VVVSRLILTLCLVAAACTRGLDLVDQSAAVVLTTSGPWKSMIYLARTDSGVIAVDLGWVGAESEIRRGLTRLAATPEDVKYVFLTHAHRDHTHAWPLVAHATFVVGAGDVPYFTGAQRYHAVLPRIGDGVVSPPLPGPGAVRFLPLRGDTALVVGNDTVRAFAVPGHTPGSMAYVVRGTVFGGDAINWRPGSGFQGARPEFSDSVEQSRESMQALWARLDPTTARTACSAHAKCAVIDSAFRQATSR
jgi:glyoxylase-like metal-dependent hydrolase (beta-lactamase superfamily II)